jgi:hypothetical protein
MYDCWERGRDAATSLPENTERGTRQRECTGEEGEKRVEARFKERRNDTVMKMPLSCDFQSTPTRA